MCVDIASRRTSFSALRSRYSCRLFSFRSVYFDPNLLDPWVLQLLSKALYKSQVRMERRKGMQCCHQFASGGAHGSENGTSGRRTLLSFNAFQGKEPIQ